MKALIPTANQLFSAIGLDKLPTVEPITTQVASLSRETMAQVEADLRRWAAEGDIYAQEALELLELDV